MDDLMSDNYRLRQYFLNSQDVPSQSLMKEKMSKPLADLYFKSMPPRIKVLAGLEPPMKGGGSDWYAPPQDLLEGRTVLKPLHKKYLSKLNCYSIDEICTKIVENRRKRMILESNIAVSESDKKWRKLIEEKCEQLFRDCSEKEASKNTEKLRKDLKEFSCLYAVSITKIESVVFNAATSEIARIQNETLQKMQDKYNILIKQQATALYDTFTNRLEAEKLTLRGEFVETLARYHTELREQIHDINVEKHVNVEKCRKFLECQRLACQVYVALKEHEECEQELDLSHHVHKKKVKILKGEIANKDYEITGLGLKEKMEKEFEIIWKTKIRTVLKFFQKYVSYCLRLLPQHADFFINMERLMLLQMNKVISYPSAENIFKQPKRFKDPVAAPHPFYLFCDKSQRQKDVPLEKDLCPKHCTSSSSHMPVIVINKRCMYAACDNFEQFTNKIKHYIHGERGDDMDFIDDHVYEYDVPVKYTTSQQLAELKLESSLLQILRQESANTGEPLVCDVCKEPYCLCSYQDAKPKSDKHGHESETKQNVSFSMPAVNISKEICKDHTVEPTIETYLKSIKPKRCSCSKTVKKHLEEHLPVYMRSLSMFDEPNKIPNYETCSLATLKKMVKEASGSAALHIKETDLVNTRDVATQSIDEDYDALCTCFSDNDMINDLMRHQPTDLSKYYKPTATATDFDYLDITSSSSSDTNSSFDTLPIRNRAQEKARMLAATFSAVPELGELFKVLCSAKSVAYRLVPKKLMSKKSFLIHK